MLTCNLKSGYILQRRFLRFISYKYTTIIIFSLILNILFGIFFFGGPNFHFLISVLQENHISNWIIIRWYTYLDLFSKKKGRKTLIFGTQKFIFNTYPSPFSTICFFGGFLSSAKISNKLTKWGSFSSIILPVYIIYSNLCSFHQSDVNKARF